MKRWDRNAVVELVAECGGIALQHYEGPGFSIKSDESIVTNADHAIEMLISEALDDPDHGAYVIGEETVEQKDDKYIGRAFESTAWIVDPIDGTAPYAHHIPTWGISIGRMECGRLTDGAVYLPVTRELFVTDGEDVLFASEFTPQTPAADARLTAVTRARSHVTDTDLKAAGMIALTQSIAKGGVLNLPNPVQALACAVMPLTYLLLGRYHSYIGTVKLWDIAGVLPMLIRSGYEMVLTNGTVVDSAVGPDVYKLNAGDPDRWKLQAQMLAAPTAADIRYLQRAIDHRRRP